MTESSSRRVAAPPRLARGGPITPRAPGKAQDDIGVTAVYLASEQAAWVTGHNLIVDGGFVASGGQGQTRAADKAALAPLLEKYSTVDDKWDTIGTAKA